MRIENDLVEIFDGHFYSNRYPGNFLGVSHFHNLGKLIFMFKFIFIFDLYRIFMRSV